MKLKVALLGPCLVLLCFGVRAQTAFLKSKELGAPVFQKIFEVWVHPGNVSFQSITLAFIGTHGSLTQEKWIKRTNHQEQKGDFLAFYLPMAMERVSCKIEMTFELESGLSKKGELQWGNCQNIPGGPADRFLSDLSVTADENQRPNKVLLTNEGAGIEEKSINVLSYLENEKGEIIWFDSQDVKIKLSSNEMMEIQLTRPLMIWQERTACRAFISVDTNHALLERKKKNNSVSFSYGACEKVPSESNHDFFDFVPTVSLKDGKLAFYIKNLGRLPLRNLDEVSYEINYFDSNHQRLLKKNLKVRPPFFGFGELRLVTEETLLQGSCDIEVFVNSDLSIKESDYNNNYFHVNVCH